MGKPRCKWVRDRLPLLAGDDLRGLDRRKVERHLIGCPQCRHHRTSLDQALEVLHAVSAASPAHSDAPSLWPGLARQIRESRRPAAQASPFSFSFASLAVSWPRRLGRWPALGLGLGLGMLLVAAVIALGARRQIDQAETRLTRNARPIAPMVSLPATPPPLVEAPAPSRETLSKLQGEAPRVVESVPTTRLGYDLDHTMPMPMGVEGRDARQSTY